MLSDSGPTAENELNEGLYLNMRRGVFDVSLRFIVPQARKHFMMPIVPRGFISTFTLVSHGILHRCKLSNRR